MHQSSNVSANFHSTTLCFNRSLRDLILKPTEKMNGGNYTVTECNAVQDQVISAVVSVLRVQAEALRHNLTPRSGKLFFFRKAIEMEEFPDFVERIKSTISADMFSTLEDIEAMEASCRVFNRKELILQSCIIFELLVRSGVNEYDLPYLEDNSP